MKTATCHIACTYKDVHNCQLFDVNQAFKAKEHDYSHSKFTKSPIKNNSKEKKQSRVGENMDLKIVHHVKFMINSSQKEAHTAHQ
jgi:hypothetical protein